jgi:hypothetical protein
VRSASVYHNSERRGRRRALRSFDPSAAKSMAFAFLSYLSAHSKLQQAAPFEPGRKSKSEPTLTRGVQEIGRPRSGSLSEANGVRDVREERS